MKHDKLGLKSGLRLMILLLLCQVPVNASADWFKPFTDWYNRHFDGIVLAETYENGIRQGLRYVNSGIAVSDSISDCHKIDSLLYVALNLYPEHAGLHELRGQYYLMAKNYDRSRYHLVKAIQYDEKNDNARRMMVRVETETGNYSSAIVYCNELLESNPYNHDLWRKKIALYDMDGNHDEAMRLLERLMTIYPESEQLRLDMAGYQDSLQRKLSRNRRVLEQERSIRSMIEKEPKAPRHYYALARLLNQTGRVEEAAEIAGMGAYACRGMKPDTLVKDTVNLARSLVVTSGSLAEMKVSILASLGRHSEAYSYMLPDTTGVSYFSNEQRRRFRQLWAEDAAVYSRYNDPYEANASYYSVRHDNDTREYLISGAIKRGYYEDALTYLKDQISYEQKKGIDTTMTVFKKYQVLKLAGRTSKARDALTSIYRPDNKSVDGDITCEYLQMRLDEGKEAMDAEQYYEAIPYLTEVRMFDSTQVDSKYANAIVDLKQVARQRIYNCMMSLKQYDQARAVLDEMNATSAIRYYDIRRASIMSSKGEYISALSILQGGYNRAAGDTLLRQALSNAYSEIALKYIKDQMEKHRLKDADSLITRALAISPTDYDLHRYGVNTALALYMRHKSAPDSIHLESRLNAANSRFPDDAHFMTKWAQYKMMCAADVADRNPQDADSIYYMVASSLTPLFNDYYDDSALSDTYAECYDHIFKYNIKQSRADFMALDRKADSALVCCPEHPTLLYWKGRINEKLKQWDVAYEYGKRAKKYDGDERSFEHRMDLIQSHLLKNSLLFEYQYSRLASEDVASANVYATYSRVLNDRNSFTVGMAYAGRDGTAIEGDTEMTKGGTGIQLSGSYEYRFSKLFSIEAYGSWSNRYFPIVSTRLRAIFDLPQDWQVSAKVGYRYLRLYTGDYEMVTPITGIDAFGSPIYGVPELARTSWISYRRRMYQCGLGVSKMLGMFYLSADGDMFYFQNKYYWNSSLKVQFYPWDSSRSHVFVTGAVGNAPESSLIDRNSSGQGNFGFEKLNTMVGFGGYLHINRYLGLGLSGSWYTMGKEKELIVGNNVDEDIINEGTYENRFYLNASVSINF